METFDYETWEWNPIEGLSEEELGRREARRHRELKQERDALLDACRDALGWITTYNETMPYGKELALQAKLQAAIAKAEVGMEGKAYR